MSYLCLGLAAFFGLSMLSMADAAQGESDDKPVVVLDTTAGPITLELDRAKAPITVDNFLKYVDSGLLQRPDLPPRHPRLHDPGRGHGRGDEGEDGRAACPDPERGEQRAEQQARDDLHGPHQRPGLRHLAVLHQPGRQRADLDPRPGSAGYAVFGKVIAGMDTVDAIAKVPTGRKGMHDDVPLKPITIKSAKRKPKS